MEPRTRCEQAATTAGSEVSGEQLRLHLAAILLATELIADAPALPDDLRAVAEALCGRTQQLARALAGRAAGRGCGCYRWAARLRSQNSPPEPSGVRS